MYVVSVWCRSVVTGDMCYMSSTVWIAVDTHQPRPVSPRSPCLRWRQSATDDHVQHGWRRGGNVPARGGLGQLVDSESWPRHLLSASLVVTAVAPGLLGRRCDAGYHRSARPACSTADRPVRGEGPWRRYSFPACRLMRRATTPAG